jgi:uncharacterized protein (TIGR04255 family)
MIARCAESPFATVGRVENIRPWMSWLQGRHYDKAPIKEAIIDIQISGAVTAILPALERINFSQHGYLERQSVLRSQLLGKLQAGEFTATTKQDQIGYQFVGAAGKQIVHCRVDGFAFSRLAPYETWEKFRDEARRLWQLYRQVAGDSAVTRIAVRYVNQMDLPANLRDFRDYIRTYPEISSDLSQLLAGFFMQVQIPQPDIGAMLFLNEALVPPTSPEVVSLVLDLDIFKDGLSLLTDDEIWDTMEVLRVRKNLVFEGCITNTTRELIS